MFKTNETVHKRTVFATENKGKQAIPKIWLGIRVRYIEVLEVYKPDK